MSPQVPGIVKPVERFTAKYKGKFTCHLLIFFFLYFSKTFLGGFSWLPCDITLARSGEGRWLGQTGTVRRVQSPVLASQCVASRSPAGLGEIEINTCQLYHSGQELPHTASSLPSLISCLLTVIMTDEIAELCGNNLFYFLRKKIVIGSHGPTML